MGWQNTEILSKQNRILGRVPAFCASTALVRCTHHVSQTCGFSPECVRMCAARFPDCENALPHVSQT